MNLALIAGWTVFLVTFLIVRPPLHSPLAWLLLVPAFVFGGAFMVSTKVAARKERQAVKDWKQRLSSLVDNPDIKDDGHLFEQFDQNEWACIFFELERLPKENRSLRKAVQIVDPEFWK